jgi:predicted alpha-1,6-mannanase (GH76 family)
MKPMQPNVKSAPIRRELPHASGKINRLAKSLLGIIAVVVTFGCGRAFADLTGDADASINGYNSAFLVTNVIYNIVNRNSGQAVDVKGGGTANGTPVDQYTINGGADQEWTVTYQGNGIYQIMGVQSGRSLDVVGGRTTNGTPIDIWDYSGGANQQWTLTPTSGGYYRITMGNDTNDCLEVPDSSTTPGVLLDESTYTGGNNQQWKLVPVVTNSAYYKGILNSSSPDGTWVADLDIQGMEDAYERTGSSAQQTLVNNLCATWLVYNPPPWSWDSWNDDIGWFSLALVRGYQMTGTANFLTQAEYGFNYAFGRGWDTNYNGGGIWEQQPPVAGVHKEALSNDSLGQVACMLYQSTGNTTYLNEAEQIYSWVRSHIYNPGTGQVYTGIDTNGTVNTAAAVYNQGTFVDYADLLYKITGNSMYYNDAIAAVNYTTNHLTTSGIIDNNASYIVTWGAEFARGLGHLCKDNPPLWATYYPFMLANANSAWSNRRTDYNITWNGWREQTPETNNQACAKVVSAVALMQFTPVTQPASVTNGTYKIVNLNSALVADCQHDQSTNGTPVQQYTYSGGANQQWTLTSLGNGYYKIIGVASGRALEVVGSGTANGTFIDIWDYSGGANQQWTFTATSGGYYRLTPQNATGSSLDVQHSGTTNSTPLEIWTSGSANSQQWSFQTP